MTTDTSTDDVGAYGTKYPASYFDIPKECKAGWVDKEGPDFKLEVKMVPVPEPGHDEVLIRLNATGICYSDVHYLLNDIGIPGMTSFGVHSPGHEGAGVIVKIGANVKNFKIGDRAGLTPIWDTCGSCELCWGDKEAHCPKRLFTGLVKPGSYQQYVVSPARYTSRIPDGVDDYVAGPIMCSATTMYRSLTEAQLRPGEWAVFPGGGGGLGIQGVQLARAMGMRSVVIDTGEAKRELCLKMGAEHFVDFATCADVPAEVVKLTGGQGAHGVFVTASAAYKDAMALVGQRVGAKIMCIGVPGADSAPMAVFPNLLLGMNITIKGTLAGSMSDTHATLQYAARGMLRPIHTVFPIDRLPEAVDKLRKGEIAGRAVIDFNA